MMRIAARWSCALLALIGLAIVSVGGAQSQEYPSKTIRIVVGFAPGGGNDIFARIIAQELQMALGQSVVVENKPGGGGRIAAEYVKDQAPDGLTLLVGPSGPMAISPAVSDKLAYATLRDFAPVTMLAAFPLVLVVNADHPARNLKEFVAWAKANPDKSNYGTSSTAFTLATELLKLKTGMPGVGIPYKSGNEMVLGVLGGQSSMVIVDPPPAVAQIAAGKLRGLAVTAAKRHDDLPDVPTIVEAGYPDVQVVLWSGVFVPAATPKPVIAKLESTLRKILQIGDVRKKFKANGTEVVGNSSQEFAAAIEKEIVMWRGVAQAANLHLE
jgi:tripartite-type tricarboxylate transporter receptor subunit TctC